MYNIFSAVVLGIVEGITEFLPISSTGHLILAQRALQFKDVEDMFTVIIQLGAIAAVIWFYRNDLLQKTAGLIKRDTDAIHFWKILALGTLPAALFGLALENSLRYLTTPLVVAIALIIGGIILYIVDRRPVPVSDHNQDTIDFSGMTIRQSLLIGLGQSVAIIPGVSRSGATIVSGLLTGLSRRTATAYSFYLSIPILVAASALKLVKHGDQLSLISGGPVSIVIGLVVSFITALLSITWLLRYISRHNFVPFAYYRIALGTIILILIVLNII